MNANQEKKAPASTKIYITIIVVLLAIMGGGGYFGYSYVYDVGYRVGYANGDKVGYDRGYQDAKNNFYTPSSTKSSLTISEDDSNTYLTSDTAPEGTVWTTPSGEKYHEAGCRYIDGRHDLIYYLSADDAIYAGFDPCSVCH